MSDLSHLLKRWIGAVIDLKRFISIFYLPRYVTHWFRFQRQQGTRLSVMRSYPCLSDWVSTTPFDPHYFYQAAWLARALRERMPGGLHVDIGSDVRMIAVLSAFVPTEFADFRPLQATVSGLDCKAANITQLPYATDALESLSCLHVVEHVGLGRYGDPLDSNGSRRALSELARVVRPQGYLYLSVPVGRETVCFNAHRVFDPYTIKSELKALSFVRFSLVTDQGVFIDDADMALAQQQEYGCGMFIFRK